MTDEKVNLTASNIKYLLAMYHMSSNNSGIRCVRIAEQLGITKPSVHTMINSLKNMGLVNKSPYGEVFFTNNGLMLAEKYSKYYILVSNFLKQHLSDDDDIRNASCAVLAEISDKGLAQFKNEKSERRESINE